MRVITRLCATVLFSLALLLALTGVGALGGGKGQSSVFDSPEASGKLIAGILPALILCVGGAWLWQRPKQAKTNDT